ncbi:cation efflux protein (plasmid) [Kineococcus radiotolerans SRS30216 = ATCC BAA-149]|uniref:Cation efflux protein n=1 Tax=Kineococcus radiotolerans (strain ATCC BAA-149 / DSM 14245 / SRS30216) TaxID=266940 RepID=A6WGS2_KINRD|nr:cation efflux protein [Kineococcus radiotolerans SRS30216 = ATCC BAA-149]
MDTTHTPHSAHPTGHGSARTTVHGAARSALSAERRDVLTRRVRMFVAATITYNVIEAVVALSAGAKAGSTALIGFGLDSVIEVSSAAAVAWQFSASDHAVREAREHRTLRIIAISFFTLAAYVSVESVRALLGDGEAEQSSVGLVLAALSLMIMPLLSAAQRRAGRELGSASAVADSKQTLLCTYLSAVLLVGLGLNAALGWSWADPIAGLIIAVIAVKEGLEAWRGEGCCTPGATLHTQNLSHDGGAGDPGGCTDGCCTPAATTPAAMSPAMSLTATQPASAERVKLTISTKPTPSSASPAPTSPAASTAAPTGDDGCSDGCCPPLR